MNQGLLLLLVCFCVFSGFSQSRERGTELEQAIQQLDHYNSTAKYLQGKSLIERTSKNYLLSKDRELKGRYAFQAGDIHHHLSKFQLSVQYFNESYHHFQTIKDFENMAEAQIGLMETYKFLKDYELSIRCGYKAIAILDSLGKKGGAMDAKTILCKPLIEYGDLVTAEKFLMELFRFYTKEKNELSIAFVLEIFAYLDFHKAKYQRALEYSEKALLKYQKGKDIDGEFIIYQLQSEIYLKERQFEKALFFAQKAIDLIKGFEDKRGLHKGHLIVATIYLKMGKYDLASTHLNLYKKMGKEIEDPAVELESQLFMLSWYREKGDWKNALLASEKYQTLQDSIKKKEEQEFITAMSVRYEISEKEKDLQQTREKNSLLKKDALIQKLIISILIAFLLILILFLNRYRLTQRKKQQLFEQELASNKQKLEHFTQRILEKNKMIQTFETQFNELTQLNESQETERTEKLNQLYHQKILTDEDWINFQRLYREVYPHFIDKLKNIDENLSEGDVRHLLLVKLNMSTREISEVLGISINSVRVSRHRLRKRLNIDEDTDLRDILDTL